ALPIPLPARFEDDPAWSRAPVLCVRQWRPYGVPRPQRGSLLSPAPLPPRPSPLPPPSFPALPALSGAQRAPYTPKPYCGGNGLQRLLQGLPPLLPQPTAANRCLRSFVTRGCQPPVAPPRSPPPAYGVR